MSDDLFPEFKGLSPRLEWIKRKNLTTDYKSYMEESPWAAWSGQLSVAIHLDDVIGFGMTEDEAIADWATKNGVLLWNEEAVALKFEKPA